MVAKAVVDDLEPVQIDEENRESLAELTMAADGSIELRQEEMTVRKVGQRVAMGDLAKLLLGLNPFRLST